MTDTMPSVIYKFLPAQFALEALEEKRLKVSRLAELNDLFDCLPRLRIPPPKGSGRIMTDDRVQKLIAGHSNNGLGLLCFSGAVVSPLLWGHYAACGTGLALGFKRPFLPRGAEFRVTYNIERPIVDTATIDLATIRAAYGAKAKAWEYEQEVRQTVALDRCQASNGMYFATFTPDKATQVIIGFRSAVRPTYVKHLLKFCGYADDVDIKLAAPHPDKYEIQLK